MVKKGLRVSETFLQLRERSASKKAQSVSEKRSLVLATVRFWKSTAVTLQYDCSGNLEEMTNEEKGSVSSWHEHKVSFMTYADRSARPWI